MPAGSNAKSGSVYRINGREVRARDVQVVFADASTGSRSPALVHQGRIGEIIQAKPEQRRRVLEEAAGISGLHARRHEAELRLRAAEHNLQRLEDVIGQLAGQIDQLKRQARQAIRYRNVSSQVRKAEAALFHLRWVAANTEVAEAERAKDLSIRMVAERTGAQAEAATRQTTTAAELPALREAEAKAASGLQRLNIARENLEKEETRAKERIAELDRRIVQLGHDIERERRLAADAQAALGRLAAEEEILRQEAQTSAARQTGVDQRAGDAGAALATVENTFTELTGALADLLARRNQLKTAARGHAERTTRLQTEIAQIESELAQLQSDSQGGADMVALAAEVDNVQTSLADAEIAYQDAETKHAAARQGLDGARTPLAEAERRVQRLETEAKTIGKFLSVETKNLWPPVMDSITVEKGYEKALGAALGDDLDAPVDPSAPMRWTGTPLDQSDPPLPLGLESLSPNMSPHRPSSPAASLRSVWSNGSMERGWPKSSIPASGWYRAKAICGAGTDLPLPPMPRPEQRGGSPNAAGSRISKASCRLRVRRSTFIGGRSSLRRSTSRKPPRPKARHGPIGASVSARLTKHATITPLPSARPADMPRGYPLWPKPRSGSAPIATRRCRLNGKPRTHSSA